MPLLYPQKVQGQKVNVCSSGSTLVEGSIEKGNCVSVVYWIGCQTFNLEGAGSNPVVDTKFERPTRRRDLSG